MSAMSFPALDAATEAALRASIERFGVIHPVIVDQNGAILDGNNRSRLAADLGVECPVHLIEVADGTDVGEMLVSLNDARRQRLTAMQRREIVAALRQD